MATGAAGAAGAADTTRAAGLEPDALMSSTSRSASAAVAASVEV
jgi:hypothetical protein